MSARKKYTMRPARKKEDGTPQMVPIGLYRGLPSALAREGEYEVTPAIHRAYMAGDIDIDDYPHKRKGEEKPKPKRTRKKPAKPAAEAPAADAAPKPDDAGNQQGGE